MSDGRCRGRLFLGFEDHRASQAGSFEDVRQDCAEFRLLAPGISEVPDSLGRVRVDVRSVSFGLEDCHVGEVE